MRLILGDHYQLEGYIFLDDKNRVKLPEIEMYGMILTNSIKYFFNCVRKHNLNDGDATDSEGDDDYYRSIKII